MPSVNLALSPPYNSAVITALVFPSEPRLTALTKQGLQSPKGEQVRLLVDSGASCTCIDANVLQKLGLTPTTKTQILTPSTDGVPIWVDNYDIQLYILSNSKADGTQTVQSSVLPHHQSLSVTGNSMAGQEVDGLLGMDVLKHCLFAINGKMNAFTLWW